MTNPAIGAHVKALFLGSAGLLIAIFVGVKIGSSNYVPLILGAAIIALACIGLFSGSFLWLLAIGSLSLAGTFPILGGSFTPFQMLMAMGIAKFLIEEVVLRRTPIKMKGDR